MAVLLAMVTAVSLLSACGGKGAKKEDTETITVYLWSTSLYEKYAPYIRQCILQSQTEKIKQFAMKNYDVLRLVTGG